MTYTFTWRVDYAKQIDTKCNARNMGRRTLGDQEAEAREEQAQGHQRERGEQQVSTSERIDGVETGDGKEPVDDTESQ